GDDDGYVDMMGFAHAHRDGACASSTNNHIWAHRWVLGAGDGGGDFVTNDPRPPPGGGFIRIRDYFIQSGLGGASACDSTQIMPIGTAAHEFGHALGLPDLYDNGGPTEGIGRWGLMGSGSFSSPLSPARMEAWSLNELGWVTVVPLDTAGTYRFGPAPTGDTTFLIRPIGSNPNGEYLLLENRQAAYADTALARNACQVWFQDGNQTSCPGGLLIWHIDSAKVAAGRFNNTVNNGSIHGVKLEEADGARDLWCPGAPGPGCNRGDSGDPYPGMTGNTAFAYTTNPAATKNANGGYLGFDVDAITQVVPGGEMSFRLTFAVPLVIQSTSPRPGGVMGARYADTLRASGGGSIYSWSVAAGSLPPGLTLASSGALSGFPAATGTFPFTARVASGGQVETRDYTIVVTAPSLTLAAVLPRLFDPAATTLTPDQLRYLDLLGNSNGQFDVGDFRAWVDSTGAPPGAPVERPGASVRKGGVR
ncbi:MAG TPA: immune inhibitor A domain-containing protein, partial [Gemmatimonadales bacterium]|nr:immune inhibitor A domain-containing protein [Gemmatimonadales bacterium]